MDKKLPLKNYFQLTNQNPCLVGILTVKLLGNNKKHKIPAVLVRLHEKTWAILTSIDDVFNEVKDDKSRFGLHIEMVSFEHNYDNPTEFKDVLEDHQDQAMHELALFHYVVGKEMPKKENVQYIKEKDRVFVLAYSLNKKTDVYRFQSKV